MRDYNPMDNPITGWAADPAAAAEQFLASPHVVGVAVAGVRDGEVDTAVVGVADHETGEPLTADHVLRPGSVTKMLTATLVMQCFDEGLVDLDAPVVRYLPGFRLRDDRAADRVLVRHLLSHTSGIDATDLFVDTGDDDEALARYVALLAGVGLLTEPGAVFSYNNAGTCLAGHLVASVRGTTWEQALRTHLLDPLGMTSTGFVNGRRQGDEGLAARLARSHLAGPAGVTALPLVATEPQWTRGLGPAGGRTVSSAADLGRFLLGHLGGAGDVPPVLRPATAATMRERVIDAPGGVVQMAGSGLGWQTWQSGDLAYVRHSGAYDGQSTMIALDPVSSAGVVIMTNSLNGHAAATQVLDTVPVPWTEAPAPADLSPYAGTYRAQLGEVVISVADGGGLQATMPAVGITAPIWPVDRGSFVGAGGACAFFGFDDAGAPQFMRFQMRALRRVGD
jgi:CubicO group peptidase (beta-lactamase class C family)